MFQIKPTTTLDRMSEEKILTLMSVTGRDRETAAMALATCSGDLAAAVDLLLVGRTSILGVKLYEEGNPARNHNGDHVDHVKDHNGDHVRVHTGDPVKDQRRSFSQRTDSHSGAPRQQAIQELHLHQALCRVCVHQNCKAIYRFPL